MSDLEERVNRAFLDCRCPFCGIYLELVSGPGPTGKTVMNIWRHHITTLHQEDVDADQR